MVMPGYRPSAMASGDTSCNGVRERAGRCEADRLMTETRVGQARERQFEQRHRQHTIWRS